MRSHRDGPRQRTGLRRAGMSSGQPQPRQHPEACACTFGTFYTDMRRMNETANETTQPYGPMTDLTYCLVRVAEGRRFELLRGCPQHAFQVCAPAFTPGRDRP